MNRLLDRPWVGTSQLEPDRPTVLSIVGLIVVPCLFLMALVGDVTFGWGLAVFMCALGATAGVGLLLPCTEPRA